MDKQKQKDIDDIVVKILDELSNYLMNEDSLETPGHYAREIVKHKEPAIVADWFGDCESTLSKAIGNMILSNGGHYHSTAPSAFKYVDEHKDVYREDYANVIYKVVARKMKS